MRTLALALLLSTMPAAVTAQVVAFKGGMSWSNLVGDDENDEGKRSAPFGGLSFAFPVSNSLAIQAEVLFTRKGAALFQQLDPGPRIVTDTLTDTTDTIPAMGLQPAAGLDMNYIEVPLLLRFAYTETEPILPSLYLGPYIAFKQDCQLVPEGDPDADRVDCEDQSADQSFMPSSTDFGLTFGGGFDLLLGRQSSFSVEGRYSVSAFSIAEGDNPPDISHSSIAFLIGLTLPLNLR